ncbi:MAG TPA: hypothetical protein VK106_03800 [Balneolaceae bacterium]|nr:hypothetical protein [Balneolaceae bacterium]
MYVINQKDQNVLLSEMTMLRKDSETLEAYYHHPSTEMMWKSFFPRANAHRRGPKILRTDPVPEQLEEWLEDCLSDKNIENARGLGIELSALPHLWQDLLNIIEQDYRKYGRKQLRVFFKYLRINKYEELFKELNIDPKEIEIEKETLNKLSRRSKIIRFKRFWFF